MAYTSSGLKGEVAQPCEQIAEERALSTSTPWQSRRPCRPEFLLHLGYDFFAAPAEVLQARLNRKPNEYAELAKWARGLESIGLHT
jgi:hypothetical protein